MAAVKLAKKTDLDALEVRTDAVESRSLDTIVIRPSGGTNGNTDTAAINNALDAYRVVILMGGTAGGVLYLNDSIQHPSDTTLVLWEAECRLVGATNKRIWRNTNQTAGGDENVYIKGFGRALFNGTAEDQDRQAGYGFLENIGMGPVSVDELHVADIQLGPTNGWGAFLQGVTNSTWRNVLLEQDGTTRYQDGLDIGVGCRNIKIAGTRGTTHDDVHAIFAMQYPSESFGLDPPVVVGVPLHSIYQPGTALPLDISDIGFSDIEVDSSSHTLIRTFCDDTTMCSKIVGRGLRETGANPGQLFSTAPSFYIDPDHQADPGCVSDVTLSGLVGGALPASFDPTVTAPITLDGHIDGLKITDVDLQGFAYPDKIVGTLEAYAYYGPTVRHTVIDGVKGVRTGTDDVGDLVNFRDGAIVDDFTLRNVDLMEARSILKNDSLSVTRLSLENIHIGKCYGAPFNSSRIEQGEAKNIAVDELDVGVTQRYATPMRLRMGGTMPVFTEDDTPPLAMTPLSRITCDETFDPTGGPGTTAGEYVSNGTEWKLAVDLDAIDVTINPVYLNPEGWFKADAIEGLADGNAVPQWDDSSLHGSHAVQATGANQPTYKTAIINGLPVVRFDGNDILDAAGVQLGQPTHIFIVCKSAVTGGPHNVTDGILTRQAVNIDTGGEWAFYSGNTVVSSLVTADTAPHILTAYFDGTDSELRLDGTSILTGNPGDFVLNGLRMGGFNAAAATWNGDIAEILVFEALSDARMQEVEDYLAFKYAIAI